MLADLGHMHTSARISIQHPPTFCIFVHICRAMPCCAMPGPHEPLRCQQQHTSLTQVCTSPS